MVVTENSAIIFVEASYLGYRVNADGILNTIFNYGQRVLPYVRPWKFGQISLIRSFKFSCRYGDLAFSVFRGFPNI